METIIPITFPEYNENNNGILLYESDEFNKNQTFYDNFLKKKKFINLFEIKNHLNNDKKYIILMRLKLTKENFSKYEKEYKNRYQNQELSINLNAPNLDRYFYIDIMLYQKDENFYPYFFEYVDKINIDKEIFSLTDEFKNKLRENGINVI